MPDRIIRGRKKGRPRVKRPRSNGERKVDTTRKGTVGMSRMVDVRFDGRVRAGR